MNTASKLCDKLLNIFTTQYDNLSEYQKKKINVLNRPENVTLDFVEDDLTPMPALGDEVKLEPEESIAEKVKVKSLKQKKTGTGSKILPPNKLLTRLPILLAQTKAGNNSSKLKNEIRQILYLLYQHNKITKNLCNNLIKSL